METIMIVEDNEIILNGLELSLKQDGYNIIKASTQKEALNQLDNTISLVLLDVTLPDGDGFDICKEIKNKTDMPINRQRRGKRRCSRFRTRRR